MCVTDEKAPKALSEWMNVACNVSKHFECQWECKSPFAIFVNFYLIFFNKFRPWSIF